ncbi:MAG: hypothetical protein AB1592_18670 [Pseudomonadota bacterium]
MWKRAWSARGAPVLILSAVTLGGCTTTTASGGRDVFCGAAAPIRWSLADTHETVRQVKAHNAVGRALCGWH